MTDGLAPLASMVFAVSRSVSAMCGAWQVIVVMVSSPGGDYHFLAIYLPTTTDAGDSVFNHALVRFTYHLLRPNACHERPFVFHNGPQH
jgi:hypothetical protein